MRSVTNDTTTYIDRPTGRIAYGLAGGGGVRGPNHTARRLNSR